MTDVPDRTKWRKVFQDYDHDLRVLATLRANPGIIPYPINATRVDKHLLDITNSTAIIYTVAAGKKLYITSAWASAVTSAAAVGGSLLAIRDGDDTLWLVLVQLYPLAVSQPSWSNQYFPGIYVPALYDVYALSSRASEWISSGFSGWLEDV